MSNFEKYSTGPGFTEDGKQINIGEIKELKDGSLEVDILAGCDLNVALETMQKIADESKKTVRAKKGIGFGDMKSEDLIATPKESEKE